MTIFFVIFLILIIVISAVYADEIKSYFNEILFQSTEEELACISNKLYNDYVSLNQDAFDAYKALIHEAVNSNQRHDR
jgi:NADH:ubiquinone oxidoreductase subunit 6 (subunit J)